MTRPLTRIEPRLPAQLFKTYSIAAPQSTHFRLATCEEANCPAYLNGWKTKPVNTDQADYVRHESGRRFTEVIEDDGPVFYFEAGQQCFNVHKIRLERDEIYVVRAGDYRRRFGEPHRVSQGQWLDDFASHQERLARQG